MDSLTTVPKGAIANFFYLKLGTTVCKNFIDFNAELLPRPHCLGLTEPAVLNERVLTGRGSQRKA